MCFFYYAVRVLCMCSLYICGLTQQVRIGCGTTWKAWETNFLSLGPDVISLTLIRLTTGPISQSYLGQAITSTCRPLVYSYRPRACKNIQQDIIYEFFLGKWNVIVHDLKSWGVSAGMERWSDVVVVLLLVQRLWRWPGIAPWYFRHLVSAGMNWI